MTSCTHATFDEPAAATAAAGVTSHLGPVDIACGCLAPPTVASPPPPTFFPTPASPLASSEWRDSESPTPSPWESTPPTPPDLALIPHGCTTSTSSGTSLIATTPLLGDLEPLHSQLLPGCTGIISPPGDSSVFVYPPEVHDAGDFGDVDDLLRNFVPDSSLSGTVPPNEYTTIDMDELRPKRPVLDFDDIWPRLPHLSLDEVQLRLPPLGQSKTLGVQVPQPLQGVSMDAVLLKLPRLNPEYSFEPKLAPLVGSGPGLGLGLKYSGADSPLGPMFSQPSTDAIPGFSNNDHLRCSSSGKSYMDHIFERPASPGLILARSRYCDETSRTCDLEFEFEIEFDAADIPAIDSDLEANSASDYEPMMDSETCSDSDCSLACSPLLDPSSGPSPYADIAAGNDPGSFCLPHTPVSPASSGDVKATVAPVASPVATGHEASLPTEEFLAPVASPEAIEPSSKCSPSVLARAKVAYRAKQKAKKQRRNRAKRAKNVTNMNAERQDESTNSECSTLVVTLDYPSLSQNANGPSSLPPSATYEDASCEPDHDLDIGCDCDDSDPDFRYKPQARCKPRAKPSEKSSMLPRAKRVGKSFRELRDKIGVMPDTSFQYGRGRGRTSKHMAVLATRKEDLPRCESAIPIVVGKSDEVLVPKIANARGKKRTDRLRDDPVLLENSMRSIRGSQGCQDSCQQSFPNLNAMAYHLDQAHEPDFRSFVCAVPHCPWSVIGFIREGECMRHMKTQHSKNALACPDPKCSKVFKRNDSYIRHYRLTHSNPHSRFNTNKQNCGDVQ